MNLPVYTGTIFLLVRILRQFQTKVSYDHVTIIPRNSGVLSGPTTEVNGNDLWCKRVRTGWIQNQTARYLQPDLDPDYFLVNALEVQ